MIPLTRAAQHAIRALTYLASQDREHYCLTRQVADVLGIPPAFLTKVLQPLAARQILDSQRGRTGGVRLAREPERVTLFEIVDAIEPIARSPECVLGQDDCADDLPCPLHDFWLDLRRRWLDKLRRTSLRDLARTCHEQPRQGYPYRRVAAAHTPSNGGPTPLREEEAEG